MPGPPWAPSPATACGEHRPPPLHPTLPGPQRSQCVHLPFSQPKLVTDLSCFTLCLALPVLRQHLYPGTHRWTDAFVGLSTCGRHMSAHRVLASLARALEDIPAGRPLTAELMAHPGYPSVPPAGGCGEGPDAFSCSWERLHELHVLTAPTLRARLAQNGVQLCAIDDLDSKRPGEGVPCEATLEPFLKPSPP